MSWGDGRSERSYVNDGRGMCGRQAVVPHILTNIYTPNKSVSEHESTGRSTENHIHLPIIASPPPYNHTPLTLKPLTLPFDVEIGRCDRAYGAVTGEIVWMPQRLCKSEYSSSILPYLEKGGEGWVFETSFSFRAVLV